MGKTEIMDFAFQGNRVRFVVIDGTPWLVARDVAERLGYTNPQKAVRDHCKHGRPVGVNGSFTLDPQLVIIPESDMYRLVMRSHMKKAEEFEEWVTGTVLPSIRKTGTYVPEGFQVPQSFPEALRLAADLAEENERQKQAIALLAPKGDFYDKVADSTNLQGVARVGKALDCGEIKFFRWLRAEGVLMSNNVPYQRYIDDGYFEVKVRTFDKPCGDSQTATTTYFTGRGVTWIQKRWAQAHRVAVEA